METRLKALQKLWRSRLPFLNVISWDLMHWIYKNRLAQQLLARTSWNFGHIKCKIVCRWPCDNFILGTTMLCRKPKFLHSQAYFTLHRLFSKFQLILAYSDKCQAVVLVEMIQSPQESMLWCHEFDNFDWLFPFSVAISLIFALFEPLQLLNRTRRDIGYDHNWIFLIHETLHKKKTIIFFRLHLNVQRQYSWDLFGPVYRHSVSFLEQTWSFSASTLADSKCSSAAREEALSDALGTRLISICKMVALSKSTTIQENNKSHFDTKN